MTIEVTAKKVEDAIKQGLEQLGASLDEVNVEIVESGGLFRKAKVRLTLDKEEPEKPQEKETPKAEAAPAKKQDGAQSHKPTEKPEAPAPAKKQENAPVKKQERAPAKKQGEKKPQQPPKQQAAAPEAHKEDRPKKTSAEYKAALDKSVDFIKTVLEKMGFTTDITVQANADGDIDITAPAGDDSLIIGRHGDTLSALAFLAETLGRADKCHINFTVDCNGYRGRRAASLTAMAKRRADECVNKKRKIKLEPMDRVDRRTIHNALNDDDRVSTASEGKEPHRYVVIIPKK